MTGITLAELECIKDIIEADIDRSEGQVRNYERKIGNV